MAFLQNGKGRTQNHPTEPAKNTNTARPPKRLSEGMSKPKVSITMRAGNK